MSMRAQSRLYEDPTSFTSEDIWDNSGDPSAKRNETIRAVAVALGLLSMGIVTSYVAYTWKYGSSLSLPSIPGFAKFSSLP
ncbi:hypothetical protein D9757_011436 [Collybiopsis confluens]|uniref:Uncharacterized protein n=1 Tax=Collybiopsis confluens TaxID=2823264 RepID=A0A8H5CRM9_9AGAR|nr:hypothetical protein D9757_013569 [Collybiopsis confluens]KAF5365022.1 hypothetical protein D9757_011436 [Collybiopsis confluens]